LKQCKVYSFFITKPPQKIFLFVSIKQILSDKKNSSEAYSSLEFYVKGINKYTHKA